MMAVEDKGQKEGRTVVDTNGGNAPERQVLVRQKKRQGISNVKIIAGAIAAIAASIISSKLTSYVGSVVIIGISSVLLAVFTQIFEHVIKKSKKLAARATYHLPYGRILPDSVSRHLDTKLKSAMGDTTGLMPTVGPVVVREESHKENHDDGKTDADGGRAGIRRLIPKSQTSRIIIMFAMIALITTGISWGVTTFTTHPNVTNLTVREQSVQRLSQAEKDAIQRAAASEVSSQIAQAQDSADNANNTNYALSKRVSALEGEVSTLQSALKTLQSENTTLQDDADAQDGTIGSLKTQISTLNAQIESLKTQISELKTDGSSGSSSSAQ